MSIDIRALMKNEIECRVQSVSESNGKVKALLLLYKDARADMKILDELFGVYGWQRTHEVINGNLFCNLDIWDKEEKRWVRKQDVGTESNTEKEKGQASDSFKRACFNLGIGRELYTSPLIRVTLNEREFDRQGAKVKCKPWTKFKVDSIGYNSNKEIEELTIVDTKGCVRYAMGEFKKEPDKPSPSTKSEPETQPKKKLSSKQIGRLYALGKTAGYDNNKVENQVKKQFKVESLYVLSKKDYDSICDTFQTIAAENKGK